MGTFKINETLKEDKEISTKREDKIIKNRHERKRHIYSIWSMVHTTIIIQTRTHSHIHKTLEATKITTISTEERENETEKLMVITRQPSK